MTPLATSRADAPNLQKYRASKRERLRVADLFSLLPPSGATALDIGTRDGHLARTLADRFTRVVALDLVLPHIEHPRIESRRGDVTALPFPNDSFDVVLCAEVLEHVPPRSLAKACSEIARVAKGAVVIGVPYRQDLRCGRTKCRNCGGINPPWGHVNAFDEARLYTLFPQLYASRISFVGATHEFTNALSASLLEFANHPFGTYEQEECCIHCRSPLGSPRERGRLQKVATRLASMIESVQRRVVHPHANWIHVRFDKPLPR